MKKTVKMVLLVIALGWLVVDQSPAFYQWEDKNGVVHYGDAPPDDAVNIVEKTEHGDVPYSVSPETPVSEPAEVKPEKQPVQNQQQSQPPEDIGEIIDTFMLAPHTKKEITFAAFEPVRVGFITDITPETVALCKNSGAGIKDRYSGEESISPYGGSCEFKPQNGYIKFYVGNLEDFPIKITVYRH